MLYVFVFHLDNFLSVLYHSTANNGINHLQALLAHHDLSYRSVLQVVSQWSSQLLTLGKWRKLMMIHNRLDSY